MIYFTELQHDQFIDLEHPYERLDPPVHPFNTKYREIVSHDALYGYANLPSEIDKHDVT